MVRWDPLGIPGVPISKLARENIFQACFSEPPEPPGSPHTLVCSVTGNFNKFQGAVRTTQKARHAYTYTDQTEQLQSIET